MKSIEALKKFVLRLFPTLQKQIGFLISIFTISLIVSHLGKFSGYEYLLIFPIPFILSIFFEHWIFKIIHFFFAMVAGFTAASSGEPFAAMVIFLPTLSLAYEYDLYKSKYWVWSLIKHIATFGFVYFTLSLGNSGPYAKGFGVEPRWALLLYTSLLLMQLIWHSRMAKARAWDKEQWEKSEIERLNTLNELRETKNDLHDALESGKVLIEAKHRRPWNAN